MDNVAVIMTPVVAAAQEAVEGMETSEDDRYDALPFAQSAGRVGLEPIPVKRLTCGFGPRRAGLSHPIRSCCVLTRTAVAAVVVPAPAELVPCPGRWAKVWCLLPAPARLRPCCTGVESKAEPLSGFG